MTDQTAVVAVRIARFRARIERMTCPFVYYLKEIFILSMEEEMEEKNDCQPG